ncbi:MAG TPA: NADH-quinone oxidoreductase subunit H [Candidatus Krumholzibacteria bacterium]|nr:NADH-quinone oxidoreductase subunit H [Candidatus Krumholzibacteria bacterium]HPD70594.1 NADH-quinone oxidoreductase subunit H [Candidatus Krumholzibacteria bacterium]HRY39706.1 NADH-quinone oxidoreductase subunit H [Candidatus Krumholzibacteria bacterium]
MSEGAPFRALVWGIAAAAVLLGWPWALAVCRRRSPAWFAGTDVVSTGELSAALRRAGRPRMGTLAGWLGLVTAAAIIPVGTAWSAADLDAGLLWLVALAVTSLALQGAVVPAAAAGGLLAIAVSAAPVVLRAASLQLADLAIAQQGGIANWFVVRDPFLCLAGIVFLASTAVLWPPRPAQPAAGDGWLQDSLRAGVPLVLSHLFVVLYLGGWWAAVPALDVAGWLHTTVKTLAVVALVIALRRRPAWRDPRLLDRRLPLLALLGCLGSAIWLVVSGAAR